MDKIENKKRKFDDVSDEVVDFIDFIKYLMDKSMSLEEITSEVLVRNNIFDTEEECTHFVQFVVKRLE